MDKNQTKMQRGFTENSSCIYTGFLYSETLNESKEGKEPIYVVTLDGQTAFDTLIDPMYAPIDCSSIVSSNLLLNCLYRGAERIPACLTPCSIWKESDAILSNFTFVVTSLYSWFNRLHRSFEMPTLTESKECKEPIYVVTLDGQKAFDTVWIRSLLRHMYVTGISNDLWSLLNQRS
jgi:hypothetical protein